MAKQHPENHCTRLYSTVLYCIHSAHHELGCVGKEGRRSNTLYNLHS